MYVVAYYHRTTNERAGWLVAYGRGKAKSLRTFFPHKARKLAFSDAAQIAGRCNAASPAFRAEVETI